MKILITGSAGFIGYHLSHQLLRLGHEVLGLDNLNTYYDEKLKLARLKKLNDLKNVNFDFIEYDLSKEKNLKDYLNDVEIVVHLAAQAGVRYSLESPNEYVNSNLIGFCNLLESIKDLNIKHFIFASSSSVYGLNTKMPFSPSDKTDYPISLYAATKKSNEVIAHSYSHLYKIPTTGLRFFTVYGPYGRPDMAYFKFTSSILNGNPINLFNNGKMERDFTYVDDVISAIEKLINQPPKQQNNKLTLSEANYQILNIGNNQPVMLEDFVKVIENACNKKAIIKYLPMQDGDVLKTYADIDDLYKKTSFKPLTKLEDGIGKFVDWYKSYYLRGSG